MADVVNIIGIWIGAFCILCVYSYLIKDNPLWRIVQATMVGAAAGHLLVMGINSIYKIGWLGLIGGEYFQILSFILGFSLYSRFWRKYAWMMKYGMSVLIGSFVGLSIRAEASTNILPQLQKVMLPILTNPVTSISNIIIIIFTLCATIYFIFTVTLTPPPKVFNIIQKIGRVCIIGALGYYLGTTFIVRYAMVINRLEYLFFTWLNIAR